MNKKLFLGMFAAAGMLFATSCSNDELDVQSGNEAQVSFSLGLEGGIATRAISDGQSAKTLVCAVYDANKTLLDKVVINDKQVDANGQYVNTDAFKGGLTDNVRITLAKGQTYTIAFWAQNGDCDAYDTDDLKAVKVDYTNGAEGESATGDINNDDTRDAFFAAETFNVEGNKEIEVTLKRPFAQINVGVTAEDWEAAIASNIEIEKSAVVINNVADEINLLTGAVKASDAMANGITYTLGGIPNEPLYVETDTTKEGKEEYVWLSMSYILVDDGSESAASVDGAQKSTLNGLKYTFAPEKGKGQPIEFAEGLAGAPVRRNWRTNILGKLLTGDVQFNITIDPAYNGDIIYPSELEEELELAATFGGTVKLTAPVTLTAPLNVTANMVIDLNGHTISGAFAKADNAENAMIQNNANLTIVGGTIKNETYNGDAAILNNGNLILDGATITGAPLADGGYSAYAVISSGKLTINKGTVVTADRGCLKLSGAGETVINGGTFTNNDIGSRDLTSHVVDVEDGGTHKLTINGGTFKHLHTSTSGGVVICNRTRGIVYVNGGNYSGGNYYGNNNLSDYGYGGTFAVTGGVYSANPAAKYLVAGYKSVAAGGVYYILPEVVADAAAAANVTTVTENTADVATALSTDNGKATMFMWNDVAYIAKYGAVVITSSADEATTTRGVVEGASGLTSATVVEGIEVVGNRTFRKCSNLETVVFPNTLTEIGPAVFQSCSKLANVTIPAGVKTIGESAFAECTSLTSINIPNGVTRLEKDVLRNTGLVSIEIPASVNYIGTYAFRDCESLTEVKILSPEFTIENNTFTNMAAPVPTMTIYVVNAEMKTYLDSVLTNYDKSYITVVVM